MNIFEDEIHVYQTFVRKNFSLLGNNYELIKEQYVIKSGIIDMLAYNKQNKCLTIIELKNICIDDSVLSQVIKYYKEIKNKYIDNYDIINTPEIIIIAPEFDKFFTITNDLPIKLFIMTIDPIHQYTIFSRFFPIIESMNAFNIINQELKLNKKKSIIISNNQQFLVNKIIYILKQYFDDKLKILKLDNHIDIIYEKIIMKITFPTSWFDNYLQINIYNRLKNYININLFYDPAIKKISTLKTVTKINIDDIPTFLKNISRVRKD